MDNAGIQISVIVPVYNAAKYLRKAIDSVVSQRMTGWELLLIDNGSVDESLKICRQYEKTYAAVHVYTQTRTGAGIARNTGLEKAKGTYVVFLDADDYLADDSVLEKLVNRIEETQSDIVVCNYERLWEERLLPATSHTVFSSEDRECTDFRFRGFFSVGTLSYVWAKIYRKSFLATHGITFENFSYAEDKLFNIECYIHQAKYAFIQDIGYVYRRNTASISYRYRPDSRICWLKIAHRIDGILGSRKEIDRAYEDFVRYILFFASFFDAKMEYLEHDRSMKAVRNMLKAYKKDPLAASGFKKLAFGREVRKLSQKMWRFMVRGFSIGMCWKMYGFLAFGIKFLIDQKIDERLSDTGMRE